MLKINSQWVFENGKSYLRLEKNRGKFTLNEIEDFLRYSQNFQGKWAIILRCGEQTCGGSGWGDEVEPKGDIVALFQLGEGENCPVCGEFMPPEYCPHCGKAYDDEESE